MSFSARDPSPPADCRTVPTADGRDPDACRIGQAYRCERMGQINTTDQASFTSSPRTDDPERPTRERPETARNGPKRGSGVPSYGRERAPRSAMCTVKGPLSCPLNWLHNGICCLHAGHGDAKRRSDTCVHDTQGHVTRRVFTHGDKAACARRVQDMCRCAVHAQCSTTVHSFCTAGSVVARAAPREVLTCTRAPIGAPERHVRP